MSARRQVRRRIVSVLLDDLKRRPAEVARLARRHGGVQVHDADGRYVFRLVIPSRPLPDYR